MTKQRVITSLEKLTPELTKKLLEQHPAGWSQNLQRITKPSGDFFHAVTLETDEIIYMVKVPVKVDSKKDLKKEEEKMEQSDDIDSESSSKPDNSSFQEPSENPFDE